MSAAPHPSRHPSNFTFSSLYVSAHSVKRIFDVNRVSLRRWADAGKLRTVDTPGGQHLHHRDDVQRIFVASEGEGEATIAAKVGICYARVSSEHQRGDLERQVACLRSAYPDFDIITDVASGLNFKRKGLLALLERVYAGGVQKVVVLYRDRLCRYGNELLEWLFAKTGTSLVVHSDRGNAESERTDDERARELADDLLSVVTVFVARNNGRRAGENRRRRKRDAAQAEGGGQGVPAAGGGGQKRRKVHAAHSTCGEEEEAQQRDGREEGKAARNGIVDRGQVTQDD